LPETPKLTSTVANKLLPPTVEPLLSWHSPTIKIRGFLVRRHALKLSILSALLKPKARSIEPSFEPNLNNPRGLISPSFWELFLLFPCAPRYV